jgi:hypothetical protein
MAWSDIANWPKTLAMSTVNLSKYVIDNLNYLKGKSGEIEFENDAIFKAATGKGIRLRRSGAANDLDVIGAGGAAVDLWINFGASKATLVNKMILTKEGNLVIVGTVDGVDVSTLKSAYDTHDGGDARNQHNAGVGTHTHASDGAEGGHMVDGVDVSALYTQVQGSAFVRYGSYVGNNVAYRGIAHGMGRVPKIVMITNAVDTVWRWDFRIFGDQDDAYMYRVGYSNGRIWVGMITTVHFFVGNASQYEWSANADGVTYRWVAIG